MFKLIDSGDIQKSDRVVVISTAHGLKFSEFKTGYHDGTLKDVKSIHRNEFVPLPADSEKIKDILFNRLDSLKIQ